jgi:hypothetical protein
MVTEVVLVFLAGFNAAGWSDACWLETALP